MFRKPSRRTRRPHSPSLCEPLEPRQLLSAILLKDLNPRAGSSSPTDLTDLNGTLLFTASSQSPNGDSRGLWRTDGTPEGTSLIKSDLSFDTTYPHLIKSGNSVFFTAWDGSYESPPYELWKTDGTPQGTMLVKDIYPGAGSPWPAELTDLNGTLFFTADHPTYGRELWKSDGTSSGTVMVKDLFPRSNASGPKNLIAAGNTLFFIGPDPTSGSALWKTDGSAAGTILVKDVDPVSSSESYDLFAAADGTLFFTIYRPVAPSGRIELWKSDGTPEGTLLVHDSLTSQPSNWKRPASYTTFNGSLFFTAPSGSASQPLRLWRTDGTPAGTAPVMDVAPSSMTSTNFDLIAFNGSLYFPASSSSTGVELWQSDGTSQGSRLFLDIAPGSIGSYPARLTVLGDTLYFSASDGQHGTELWRTDGTIPGTFMAKDIYPGIVSSVLSSVRTPPLYSYHTPSLPFSIFGGRLAFPANDGTHGAELWISDGTSNGTRLLKDIAPATLNSSPTPTIAFNDAIYFGATDGSYFGLWKTDGTADGTTRTTDVYIRSLAVSQNQLYIANRTDSLGNSKLWKSDGTSRGAVLAQVQNIDNLIDVNGTLFFTAYRPNSGFELWKTDGTPDGTSSLKLIYPSPTSSLPYGYGSVAYKGMLFFVGYDAEHGLELWRSDGTPEGTVLIHDLTPGPANSTFAQFTLSGGNLYLKLDAGEFIELWKTDGTQEGATLLQRTRDTSYSGVCASVDNADTLYFGAEGLWKTDDTPQGTVQISALAANNVPSRTPQLLTNVNGTLFFALYDEQTSSFELWKSDGTAPGTTLIKSGITLAFAQYGQYPIVALGDLLIFVATSPETGPELWRSDGTPEGTRLLKDIYPGPTSSLPFDLRSINNTLYFSAYDPAYGLELFRLSPPTAHIATSSSASLNTPLTLDASTSSDPDPAETLTYAWDLDHDGLFIDATGPTPAFTPTSLGLFPIALRVTNSAGLASTTSLTLSVTYDLLRGPLTLPNTPLSQAEAWIRSHHLYTSSPTPHTTLAPFPQPDGSILVKLTYYGDTNNDGQVNLTDYFTIDSGYLNQCKGFTNGDVNLDGEINLTDYFLIDSAYLNQQPPLASSSSSTRTKKVLKAPKKKPKTKPTFSSNKRIH